MTAHATKILRQLLFLTVILTLGLRSLIPVGYMPDFSGQGKGLFPIVICDGLDHTQDSMGMDMPMDHPMPMHHHHSGGHGQNSDLCPSGIGAIAAHSLSGLGIIIH